MLRGRACCYFFSIDARSSLGAKCKFASTFLTPKDSSSFYGPPKGPMIFDIFNFAFCHARLPSLGEHAPVVLEQLEFRWTPHTVIVTIRDSGNYIGALYHTTITGWGVHLRWRHQRFFEFASRSVALRSCVLHVLFVQTMTTGQPVGRFSGCSPFTSSYAKHSAARLYGQIASLHELCGTEWVGGPFRAMDYLLADKLQQSNPGGSCVCACSLKGM